MPALTGRAGNIPWTYHSRNSHSRNSSLQEQPDYNGSCFLALKIRSWLYKGNSPVDFLSLRFLAFFPPACSIEITLAGRLLVNDLFFNMEEDWRLIIEYLHTIYFTIYNRSMSMVKPLYEGGHWFALSEPYDVSQPLV
ncbi:hypothetical protein A4R26_31245 [Niastella populi]|uniref:Uncharacterized protein n=1 Tax=Niastella populi TaxID=550983 RepID=A0A1V9ES14_9BACT|nr:hypothetical protein A4R26_31245 [Niastella populi]